MTSQAPWSYLLEVFDFELVHHMDLNEMIKEFLLHSSFKLGRRAVSCGLLGMCFIERPVGRENNRLFRGLDGIEVMCGPFARFHVSLRIW